MNKKKTKSFIKKAGKKTSDIVSALETQWEKEKPQREKLKISAKKALENGIKVGSDVFETIKRNVDEIKKQKGAKK